MPRPIIRDPARFDGAPHVEGSGRTVAEIQAVWREPGVGAVEMRRRFPDLTEAELGAAVTWVEPSRPKYEFFAESSGPPARRLTLSGEEGNWVFERQDLTPGAKPYAVDFWEDRVEQVLAYPEFHATNNLVWKNSRTGEVVDIHALTFDEA
ncbi:MAG: hypothetical protein KF910_06115 [Brevundimonas sp.]|uniref:hypothetical protein n=1 Tax=Brevundimonas sp. TaxID=1871086 RepID=UPI0025B99D61|nr:hypothetical protein [Brevundimonas sp.]MBX3477160.1 hypothetical protein [Brevundimonas sp.]